MVASGIVRGRFLLAKANVTSTAQGSITFTPVEPDEIVDVPAETLYSRQAVEAVFDGDGWIHAQGTPVDYLRLPVGRWEVSFRQVKGTTITPFQFDVTVDETVNLPAVAPVKPSPAVKFVVNELVYTETLDARDETFEARDVAVQAAADAVAPTNTVVDARIAVKRGAANGVAALGSDSKLPETQVPDRLSPAQLSSTFAPVVKTAVLTRDTAGRITSAVENGVTVTYTRDAQGRIQSETKNGKTTTYMRDAAGRVSGWETA